MAKTLAQARTAVQTTLGDTSAAIWSAGEIDGYLAEGYRDLCRRVGVLWKRDTQDDTAGTALYQLPADLLVLERVTWKDKKIIPARMRQLQRFEPSFLTTEGDVYAYILDGDGPNLMRKVRIPAETAVGRTRLEYQRRPLALSASQDFEIPDYMVKYVQWFAQARCLERNGIGQDLAFSKHFKDRYELAVARLLVRKARWTGARTGRLGGDLSDPLLLPPALRWPWNYGGHIA